MTTNETPEDGMVKEPKKVEEPKTIIVGADPQSDPLTARLQELGVPVEVIEKIKSDLGATTVEQLSSLIEQDLIDVGMKKLPARDLLKKLAVSSVEQANAGLSAVDSSASQATISMLEQLPSDDALLSSLRVGGVLKIEHARVVMAGRCLLARQTNMYGADKRVMSMINDHYTNALQEPNPKIFWELSGQRTKNRYASIFNALHMPGASVYATPAARNAFWVKMGELFIPKLQDVQRQLTAWYDTWVKQAQANIGLNLLGQAGGAMVPRQRMPLINHIIASVDAMIDSANKLFAGENEVVAIALGVDAQRLRELLKRNDLHSFTGSASREVMLRELGVAATSDVTMMENDFSTYLHNVLRVQTLPSTGPTTAVFLQELQEIGENIDWTRLGKKIEVKATTGKITGIGGRGRDDDDLPDDEEL